MTTVGWLVLIGVAYWVGVLNGLIVEDSNGDPANALALVCHIIMGVLTLTTVVMAVFRGVTL